jgi:hypothetical protein
MSFKRQWDYPALQVPWTDALGATAGAANWPASSTSQTVQDDELAAVRDTAAAAIEQSLLAPTPAQYVSGPGQMATGNDGSIFTLGPNGEVYKDAVQMPNLAAQAVCTFGLNLYAKGKTNPQWWRWTGSTWAGPLTAIDVTILN